MFGWLGKRGGGEPQPIDPGLWESATQPYLFMRGMPPGDDERLRNLAAGFLARKHFSGTHGLELTPFMRVQVAAQACILVLELGLELFDGWSEIIVYPGQFAPEREVVDEAGVVHLVNDPMAGEAWLGGPVILSYEDVAMTGIEAARLESARAKVSIAGSGDVTLWVRESLDVSTVGSGDVRYLGDPVVKSSAIGSGSVTRVGPAP